MKHDKKSNASKLDAFDKSQAIIEFNLDGTIADANQNFLDTVGYRLVDIQGKHHSMFVDTEFGKSSEYKEFWAKLKRGEFESAEYRRVGNHGKEVWIQASYNPMMDAKGNPFRVVKIATDVTARKLQDADSSGQLAAINKSQAVIHFALDGTILDANDNFLKTIGYSLDEIRGKHHRLFVEPSYAESREYAEFWAKLRAGNFDSGEYKRLGKGGKEIWINASYNPIFDMNGRLFKVVKFATDITQQKMQEADKSGQIAAINKSQAVIEFNMDGTIIHANPNFLSAVGYALEEIKGQHHRLFVEPAYGNSSEYSDFWARLKRGEYQQAEYMRLGKGGREVYIQASYNPIMDMNGKLFKVVKYATDITALVLARRDVARSSETTMINVQTVATAAEELTASISEISRNTLRSKEAVHDIQAKTTAADESTAKLQQMTRDMDELVSLIQDIAGQINLLALNATIESARAGEAGRGFAVVASEVKNLAQQTTGATKRISQEIKSVQEVSGHVVAALQAISGTVNEVTDLVSGTATAIEQQGAVTREISSSMQTAAVGVAEINDKISKIANAA